MAHSGVQASEDTQYTQSSAISFAPSETVTLAGITTKGGPSNFVVSSPLTGEAPLGKGMGAIDGLPAVTGSVPPLPLIGVGVGAGGVLDVVVPPEHKARTLVLCFDGTGDQFDSDNSNIVELFSALKKDDPGKQMVYYQAGIGTYTVPQIATPMMAKVSKSLDEAIAWNLDAHIMGGYEFLMTNYKAGDKICIFGFSRGAYTARCLAGMIHKVGLLPACNHQQIPFAYKMYTRADQVGWQQSNAFKAAFCTHVRVDFVGVWDTVSSVGLIPRHLPFTTSNTGVRVFRHAIALDERRAKFKQNTWNRPTPAEARLSARDRTVNRVAAAPSHQSALLSALRAQNKGKIKSERALEREYSEIFESPTDVEEVWFAGCHCDVGGGSVSNGTRPNLARIPLRWMIRQLFLTDTGIMFHSSVLRRIGLDLEPTTCMPVLERPPALPIPEGAVIRSIPPQTSNGTTEEEQEAHVMAAAMAEASLSEGELELRDALSPIYDQLSLSWWWWILELLPLKHSYQKEDSSWTWWLGMNFGGGRHIPRQMRHGVKVHRSVKIRMEAKCPDGSKYFPKANLKLNKVTWVD